MVKQVWKRVLAFVLAFAMVICDAGLSNLVYASEDETETEETVEAATIAASAADETSDAETYLKETLTAAWDAGLSYVELDEDYGITSDLLAEVYEDCITYDYKYFYVYAYRSYGYDSDDDGTVDIPLGIWITYGLEDGLYGTDTSDVSVMNDLTAAQLADIATKQQEIADIIAEIVAGADSGWTDVEKVLYLNDYLAENCQYDQDAYEQNNTTERMPFTIYGALINQICVCQGYAHSFLILAQELGLEAELVDSESLGHQWNAVKINGSWYLIDVTWDDPVKTTRVSDEDGQLNDTIGKISHTYFLKSLDYFCDGTDHTTHLGEDDWVFTGGLTKADITGSAYDSYIWDEVRTPFIYDSARGVWYAMVAESDDDATSIENLDPTGTVYEITFSLSGSVVTYKQTQLFTVEDMWSDEDHGTLRLGLYGLDYYDGLLYYTTTDTIYVYDIDAKESRYYSGLTDAQKEAGDIYGMKITEDGTIYAQLSKSYNDVGTIVALCNLKNSQDIADAAITLSSTSYDYDGTEKKPAVTIKKGTTVLNEGTDYRIEYPDDVKNAETKTITITGIGSYHGTTAATYTIEKVNIHSSDINGMMSVLELTYGQSTTPYKTYNSGSETHDLTTSKNKSGDESIVTITNGKIQAVGVGETVIYYYIGDEENYNYIELPVVVSRADQTVSTVGDCSLTYGSSGTVSASTTGDGTISFASSDDSVAYVEVQSDGTYKLITAGAGTATITVTVSQTEHYNSASKTFVVTVTQAPQYLSVKTQGNTTLYVGDTTTWTFATTGDGTIKYSSSDTGIATVSSSGVVTAKAVGVVTITAVAQESTDYTESAAATVTILICPAATSSISLSNTSSGVKLTWKQVAGADGYYIYRGSSANPFAQVTSGSTVTYTDTNSRTSGTTYTYKIVAYYNYTLGTSSGMVLGKESSSKSIKYLSQGSISSLTNAASGVTVKWSKVTGAGGYYIYRGSEIVKTITSGSTVSWTDTDVKSKSGTTYKYYVMAYSGSYKGAKSSATSIKRLTQGSISSLTNAASGVTVKWSKVSGASGYYIYRGSSIVKTITSGSTVSWTDTSVKSKSGTTYKYYVVAYSGSYTGAKSSAKSIIRLTQGKVSSLTNVSTGVTVKWSKVSGAKGYYIYRGSSIVKTITSGSTTSWTDTGVKSKNGTSYTYYVVAYSGSYKGAKSSGVKTVRLTAPTLSSVKNSASKAMTATYTKNSKATGYSIEYSTSKSFTTSTTKTVKVTSASTLSKKVTGLTKNKTYYVRVRAYKTVSGTTYYSAYSSTKSVKISK